MHYKRATKLEVRITNRVLISRIFVSLSSPNQTKFNRRHGPQILRRRQLEMRESLLHTNFFLLSFHWKKKLINRSCSHSGLTVQLLVLVDLGSCCCFIMNQHDYWLYNMGYDQNQFFLIYIYIFWCVAEWDIWGSEEDCFYIEWSWGSFWGCCG